LVEPLARQDLEEDLVEVGAVHAGDAPSGERAKRAMMSSV
jgi:hypothetical protein